MSRPSTQSPSSWPVPASFTVRLRGGCTTWASVVVRIGNRKTIDRRRHDQPWPLSAVESERGGYAGLGGRPPLGPPAVHLHLRPCLLGQLPAQVEPARLGLLEPGHRQPDHVRRRQALIPRRPGRRLGPSVLLISQVDRDPLVLRRLDVLTLRRHAASRRRWHRQLGPGRPGPVDAVTFKR
jgi:hypothetical protein